MSTTPTKANIKISADSFLDYRKRSRRDAATDNFPSQPVSLLPLIAFCHLQWDWVWQRPQQFLSRLAQHRPVLFVETHRSRTDHAFARVRDRESSCQLTVIEIHLPDYRWEDCDFIDAERRRVLQEALTLKRLACFAGAVLWFNDPMAVTAYAGHLGEALLVYDCMDELTQFNGAPPALAQRERELTCRADLIFCGGRKIRDKRLPLNANTHFYGTGVDCAHFGCALREETPIDAHIAALPGPVLGYFGVIDERIDYELVAALADAFPHGSIAMVGPIAKVDPSALPRRPNLHWLGERPYARLPAITKGFQVCLIPFALNASTEFINPTKALEYMAAGRPVVSTALDEVRTNCSAAVCIGQTHGEFIAMAVEEATAPSPTRVAAGLELSARNGWDAITSELSQHIERSLAQKRSQKKSARAHSRQAHLTKAGPTQCLTI